ncbi:MAG: MerR family transcriptional regulator [candidate division KSB1 bacterium]|nr:MerR family transcriptional regulator [candidate division KSB1 bacterium]
MQKRPIKRLYYSITEVSEITGLKAYVLRYWETEFSELKPGKNRAGNRIYKKKDIQLIQLIKRLLYQEKYTIEGARQKLSQLNDQKDKASQLSLLEPDKNKKLLQELRKGLQECLELLDS